MADHGALSTRGTACWPRRGCGGAGTAKSLYEKSRSQAEGRSAMREIALTSASPPVRYRSVSWSGSVTTVETSTPSSRVEGTTRYCSQLPLVESTLKRRGTSRSANARTVPNSVCRIRTWIKKVCQKSPEWRSGNRCGLKVQGVTSVAGDGVHVRWEVATTRTKAPSSALAL